MKNIFKLSEEGYQSRCGAFYECKVIQGGAKVPKGWSPTLEKALSKKPKAEPKAEPVPAQIPGA